MSAVVVVDDSRPFAVQVLMDSPTTRNRLDDRLLDDLVAAVDRAEATPGARALVLKAAGDTYCSGLSLGDLDHADWQGRITAIATLLRRLTTSPLVTIAVVGGAALGGGVGLAAACDQVIAHPDATFQMTEVLLGLVPAAILPVVARRVGEQRAFSMALTARRVPGAEAVDLGLADRLGGAAELRSLLVALRGTAPATARALKDYRRRLFPTAPGTEELVMQVLTERFADPLTRGRLDRLRDNGLVP